MSKAVDFFSGILFVRTRHYDDVKKVVVLQGNKTERRFFEERPQGEWIDYDNTFYKCPDCGYLLAKCCPQCQNKVILPKGGAE